MYVRQDAQASNGYDLTSRLPVVIESNEARIPLPIWALQYHTHLYACRFGAKLRRMSSVEIGCQRHSRRAAVAYTLRA